MSQPASQSVSQSVMSVGSDRPIDGQ